MPAEARVTRTWIQQKGLIPVFLIGFSLWFLWDGLIGYPRSNERWDKHEELKNKPGEWEKYCAAKGWTTEVPHERFGTSKINAQYVCAGVACAIGVFSLIYWLRAKKAVIRSETDAVITPSGRRVNYANITRIDLRKWSSKGLATVSYSDDGTKGRFVLDDAKYEPAALDVIVADLREHAAGSAKVIE
jgi:hypothetical protein